MSVRVREERRPRATPIFELCRIVGSLDPFTHLSKNRGETRARTPHSSTTTPLTMPPTAKRELCLGIEGSANKVGVGIVDGDGNVLANPRKT